MTKKRVLFVCMGNICRSPAGEGVMRHLVAERGLEDRIEVDSAGTIAYHAGDPADSRMRAAASARDYALESRGRQVTAEDLETFDLVVAMDRDNLGDLRSLDGRGRAPLRLLSDFLPPGSPRDVPDPYYGGARGFEVVLDMIEQACPAILDELLGGDAQGRA